MRRLRNPRPRSLQISTRGAEGSSLRPCIDISRPLGTVTLLKADDSFYGVGTSLFPLGPPSLLGHLSPCTLTFGARAATDGGKLAELKPARRLSAGPGAQWTSGRRRGSGPDLTAGGLGHTEKIRRGQQDKFPKDTPRQGGMGSECRGVNIFHQRFSPGESSSGEFWGRRRGLKQTQEQILNFDTFNYITTRSSTAFM